MRTSLSPINEKQEAFGKSSKSNTWDNQSIKYNLGKSFSQGPGEEEKQPRRIKAGTDESWPGRDTGEDTQNRRELARVGHQEDTEGEPSPPQPLELMSLHQLAQNP